ncbi:phosphatidylinositol-specific phospholipase C/glycerophosphodiester phosphodiesterase family protein [Mucilaginibacter sp. KACC 22063]|uniref:phosphatidylinositol-specific phospholipase C/glycerophosphodiester phosphodiesterase family protein n=1 Tax=Mucilaginibacter sp. KACC 22063 TaxID=3025666 RepID=UPI0023665C7F|nr:phosphatidylinositol-specific phospholipase C/glycerophosphodiester phosphodiesterase family protein [Mucilaginibacter sp. KACC 22063]WDF55417.1 phosphatidylinositol-specific phospholipase C/glycerophosphodiester phosphodiesterase family protein [Mucilaginibacter sp. KACC 22063]
MHKASDCHKHLKLFLIFWLMFFGKAAYPQTVSLKNAFAHNDYWHKRPLYDALDNGYTQVEADVYLRGNKLIVAHVLPILRRHKYLEDLYLKPLADCVNGNNSKLNCPEYPVMLMIDIKSDAESTYIALEQLLNRYSHLLSSYEDGKFIQRKITVVITGHKPYHIMATQKTRLAFLDDNLMRPSQDTVSAAMYRTASCRFSKLVKWDGQGIMPDTERQKLCAFVGMAHKFGKKVRLWASPENKGVWQQLLDCGVDLINTDKLVELKNYLLYDRKTQSLSEKPVTAGL